MANEIRLRRNNIAGTITDNPLTIGATTINSAGFADLPVVDATNHLILILDPLEVGGTAEIVRVTAHTAAATSLTVVRGQEGSVARSHVFNTTWFHGPVASDYTLSDVTSGARPSVPYEGELIYETDTNKLMGYTGTDWAPRDAGGQLANGYAQVVVSQSGIAGDTDLTGLAVTVTVGTGRRIKITGHGLLQAVTTAGTVVGRIKEGGTTLGRFGGGGIDAATGTILSEGSVVITPTPGSHTYKLSLEKETGGNTATLLAAADFPAFILVEDIGAA